MPPLPNPFAPTDDDSEEQDSAPVAARTAQATAEPEEDDEGGDVLDSLRAPRRQIDTRLGNPLYYTGAARQVFAPQVADAQRVQSRNDVLDRMQAKSDAAEQRRAQAQADREAQAAADQKQAEDNSALKDDFLARGVVHRMDPATGYYKPVLDETGNVQFHPKTGKEVQYDEKTGQAYTENRDTAGKTSRVYPDADAPIGHAPNDLANLYKQNKATGWQHVASVADVLANPDQYDQPTKDAAQTAQDAAQKMQHSAAKDALKGQENAVDAEESDAEDDFLAKKKQRETALAPLEAEFNAIKGSPAWASAPANAQNPSKPAATWGGISDESRQAAQRIRDLTQQINDIRTASPDKTGTEEDPSSPEFKKRYADQRAMALHKARKFDALVAKHGSVEGAVNDWTNHLASIGQDPAQDPVVKSVNAARKKAGLPPIGGKTAAADLMPYNGPLDPENTGADADDESKAAPETSAPAAEQAQPAQAQPDESDPVGGGVVKGRNDLSNFITEQKQKIGEAAKASAAAIAPLSAQVQVAAGQINDLESQKAGITAKLDRLLPGSGPVNSRLSNLTPAQFAKVQPLLAQLSPLTEQSARLQAQSAPLFDAHHAALAEHVKQFGDGENPGEAQQAAQAEIDGRQADLEAQTNDAAKIAQEMAAQKQAADIAPALTRRVMDTAGAGISAMTGAAAIGADKDGGFTRTPLDWSDENTPAGKIDSAKRDAEFTLLHLTGRNFNASKPDENAKDWQEFLDSPLAKHSPAAVQQARTALDELEHTGRVRAAFEAAARSGNPTANSLAVADHLDEMDRIKMEMGREDFDPDSGDGKDLADRYARLNAEVGAATQKPAKPTGSAGEQALGKAGLAVGEGLSGVADFARRISGEFRTASTPEDKAAQKKIEENMKPLIAQRDALMQQKPPLGASVSEMREWSKKMEAMNDQIVSMHEAATEHNAPRKGSVAEALSEYNDTIRNYWGVNPEDKRALSQVGRFIGGVLPFLIPGGQSKLGATIAGYGGMALASFGSSAEAMDQVEKQLVAAGVVDPDKIAAARREVGDTELLKSAITMAAFGYIGGKGIQLGEKVGEKVFGKGMGKIARYTSAAAGATAGNVAADLGIGALQGQGPNSDGMLSAFGWGLIMGKHHMTGHGKTVEALDQQHADMKGGLAQYEKGQDETPSDGVRAITEAPIPEAAALGHQGLPGHGDKIDAADAKIDTARKKWEALDQPAGTLNIEDRAKRNAALGELLQAHEERRGLLREAVDNRQQQQQVAEAGQEIDALTPGSHPDLATGGNIEDTRAVARALVKVAMGSPMEALTAQERAALDAPAPDGSPISRVEMVKGADGKEHPVITDQAIERLRRVAPAAADLIAKDEATRRKEILSKPEEAAPEAQKAAPAAGDQGKENAASPSDTKKSAERQQKVEPMRALSKEEESRVGALRAKLRNSGVNETLADRIARGYVSNPKNKAMEGKPGEHFEGVIKALRATGGHTENTEPDYAKRAEANKAALEAHDSADAEIAEPMKEKAADELSKQIDDTLKTRGIFRRPDGKLTTTKGKGVQISDQDRDRVRDAVKNVAVAIKRKLTGTGITLRIVSGAAGETTYGNPTSGGMWTKGSEIRLGVHDLITRMVAEELRSPERADAVADEELAHVLINRHFTPAELRTFWNGIAKEAPQFADLVRKTYGAEDPLELAHEAIRMGSQIARGKNLTEAESGAVLDSEVKGPDARGIRVVLGKVRDFLAKLVARLRDYRASLKAEGASDALIAFYDNAVQTVSKEIGKISADARRLDPYLVLHEQTTETEHPGGGGDGREAPGGVVSDDRGSGGAGEARQSGAAGASGKGNDSVAGVHAGASAAGEELARAKADLARANEELAKAKGENEEHQRQKEVALARQNVATKVRANRLADFQQVIASVPEDARPQAEELLKQAVIGAPTYVVGVNYQEMPASYIAVAPGLVQTSHLPEQGFAPNPEGVTNTRDYSKNKAEQDKVNNMAKEGNLPVGSIVSNTKTAADGPPQIALVIKPDGEAVLQTAGGNAREMASNLSKPSDQGRLADEWQGGAGIYGFKDLPDGYRGYRFLGVYDLRDPARAKEYAKLVDDLNPTPGQAAGTEERAQIDARLKINPEALAGVTLDISPDQAASKLTDLVNNPENGLEKTTMQAIAKAGPNAQLYMRQLVLASAFRSPVISEFYFNQDGTRGAVTAKELVKGAAGAAMELRRKGADGVADAIAKTLAEVIDYTNKGQNIGSAIKSAADQVTTGEEGKIVQDIAAALKDQVVYRKQRKDGIRTVEPFDTADNFHQMFEDIARAVGNYSPEPDLLGERDSIEATLKRALDVNAKRRAAEAQVGEIQKSQPPRERNWDLLAENLRSDIDSFNPARDTGRKNYELDDVIDRFVEYAKADASGRSLSKLATEFAKTDEASTSQLRKLHASIKSLEGQSEIQKSRTATQDETRDRRRMRELLQKQREQGLNRWEQADLDTLEKKAGQKFMGFFDQAKKEPKFTLDQQITGSGRRDAEQMALLSKAGKKSADEPGETPYGDTEDERETRKPAAEGTEEKDAGAQQLPGRGELQQRAGGMVEGRRGQPGGLRGDVRETRRIDEHGRDARVLKAFGEEWPHGWNALGLPNQPQPLHEGHPLLKPTKEKESALLTDKSKAARLGLLSPGRHSRGDLARAIVDYFVRGGDGKKKLSELPPMKANETPEIMFLGGGGGAGKSSMLGKLTERGEFNPQNRVLVNADEVREFLPEYDQILAAGDARASLVTHEESSTISKEIYRRARQNRSDITFDGTLANKGKGIGMIKTAKDEGYRPRMVAVTIDPHEAMQRAYLRGKGNGRYVPDEVLLEAHKGFNGAVPEYADELGHDISIYDNSPIHAIRIAPDEMKEGPAREMVDSRAKLDQKAKDLDSLLASYGETRDSEVNNIGIQRARTGTYDPNQLDIFGGNPLTDEATPRKETHAKRPKPRSDDETPGLDTGDLFLGGLRADSQKPGAPEGVGAGEDAAGSGSESRPGGSKGGGNGDGLSGRGGKGASVLEGSEPAGTGEDGSGVSGSLGQGGSGDASNEPRVIQRPAEGTPERNAKIDGSRSYAPKQGKERFEKNMEAIRLMRKLEEEGRNPTTTEKEKLLAYTGWGWMKEAFNKIRAQKWADQQKEFRETYDREKSRYDDAEDWKRRSYGIRDPGTWEDYQKDRGNYTDDEHELAQWGKNYGPSYERLRAELSDEEFDSAAKSVRNAHYTDVPIISAIWKLVHRLGFKGGNATEPGAGIGHFIGAQPEETASKTRWNAVELDGVTARILGHLYPEANVNGEPSKAGRKIEGQGFQSARIPNGSQDLVISNVPFAKEGPAQAEKEFGTPFNLHNYFFARAFAKAKPGGLVAFITSNGTMDNRLEQRQALAKMGDLVGAIRLPNNAFKANAGTEVTTDIMVFRKRDGTHGGFEPQNWQFTREVNRVPMEVNKPEGMGTLDWLKQQPSEWIPEDPAVAEAYKAWTDGNRPKTGQKVNALLDAMREAGQMNTMRYVAPVMANEYWQNHPEHALGEHGLEGSQYRKDQYALTAKDGQNTLEDLDKAIQTFPENIAGSDAAAGPERETAGKRDKMGSYIERDGKIYRVDPDGLSRPDWMDSGVKPDDNAKTVNRKENAARERLKIFKGWSRVREAYSNLIDLELGNASEADIEDGRRALNQAYDSARNNYGPLAEERAISNKYRFLKADPDYIPLQSLEKVTEDVNDAGKKVYSYAKADIFDKRQIRGTPIPDHADTIQDAVLFDMSKNGFLHIPHVAELMGISEAAAREKLIEAGLGFTDPVQGTMELADSYLSGNVRVKLDAAIEAAATDPKFRANVEALQKVLPPWESVATIHANPRANWVPQEVIQSFAERVLGLDRVRVEKVANTTVFHGANVGSTDAKFEGGGLSAASILDKIIGDKKIVVTRREGSGKDAKTVIDGGATSAANNAREEIERAFDEYTKTSPEKVTIDGKEATIPEHIEQAFNNEVGGWVPPTFNGDWITLPGQSGEIYLDRGFRKAVLARMLTLGYGMIAHGVGSGKTLTQVALAMEMRRLGKSKKPVIVVEKSTIGQFAASFRRAYPQAKLLVAGDANFGPEDRARFLGMMQTGDWDAVIMTRPQVTKIPHSPEALDDFISRKLADLDAALLRTEDGSDAQGAIQSARDKLVEMINKMAAKLAENQDMQGVTWEKLGVDSLIVDEAHNFKNTFVYTTKENVKNLPTGQCSQQAVSMELKTAAVRARNNGKGIFFATGTPVSNAMHEAWVMMNYIAPHVLDENGIGTFDQFADTYGQTVTNPEATWKGEVKDTTRFAKFVHGQALVNVIRSVFDVAMGNAKLGLDVPKMKGGAAKLNVLDQTPPMEKVNDWVVNNIAESWKAMFGEKDEDGNIIVPSMSGLRDYIEENPWVTAVPIMTMQAGVAAALDPRMLHDKAEDHPDSKVNTVVRNILARYHDADHAEKKTAQVIFTDLRNPFNTDRLEEFTGVNPFSDLGPNERKFDLYEDIAKKLVAGGIPRSEIGWLEPGTNDDKKEEFFDKVNAGLVRVVIGGEGISTGVNFQERLGAAYHLMPPRNFKPAQMEQRNGRIIRQGNLFAEWGHNAFTDAVEQRAGESFAGNTQLKRRNAAEKWLEANDRGGDIRKEADAAEDKYAVDVHEMAMKKSLDSAIYSMMSAKQGFIAQILSGNVGSEFEDPTDAIQLSMAQMAAEAIGDPRLIRKIELERTVRKMKSERQGWVSKHSDLQQQARYAQGSIISIGNKLEQMRPLVSKFEGLFTKRTDAEGKQIAPMYEFGNGAKFDAAAKPKKAEGEAEQPEQEKGGATGAIDRYLMDAWANRRGGANAVVAPGSITINGTPVRIEVHTPLGEGAEGMPGVFTLGDGQEYSFKGGKSLIQKLRNVLGEYPRQVSGMEFALDNARANLKKNQAALESYPQEYSREDELRQASGELDALKRGITAAQQAAQEARRIKNKPGGAKPETRLGEPAPEDYNDVAREENEGGIPLLARTGTLPEGSTSDLVSSHIGMAHDIADRFDNTPGSDRDERRAEARRALVKAARGYDPAKGDFANYAGTSVRNALRDHFTRQKDYTAHEKTTLDEPFSEGEPETRKDLLPASTSVTADAQTDDMRKAIQDAIAGLPQSLRDIVNGIADGDTLKAMGERQGITKQGAARKADVALSRMRAALQSKGIRSTDDLIQRARTGTPPEDSAEAIRRLVAGARAEKVISGQRTIGRPDLALSTLDPIMMGVDEYRKQTSQPQTHAEWQAKADRELANNPAKMRQDFVDRARGGDLLNAWETKAAMKLVADGIRDVYKVPEADRAQAERDACLLANSYRDIRAEQARGLAAGVDPFKTPAERHREFFAKAMYSPPELRRKLDAAKTPAERDAAVDAHLKDLAKIKEVFAKHDVSLDDLFSGRAEFRLQAWKSAQDAAATLKGSEKKAMDALMKDPGDVKGAAKESGLTPAQVEGVRQKVIAELRAKHFAKFQKGLTAERVDSGIQKSQVATADAEAEFQKFLIAAGVMPDPAPRPSRRKVPGKPFDITDPVSVVRLANDLRSRMGNNGLDMAMEYYVNGLLSSPNTLVNVIASNAMNAAYTMTIQRAAEVLVNTFVRDPKQAQWGEATRNIAGMLSSKSFLNAWRLAVMTFRAEHDMVDHALLNEPVNLDKISGYVSKHQAIPGVIGKIIRIPGRTHAFMGAFFKAFIAHADVSSRALRIANTEGLQGAAREARIKELVDQPGSPAWIEAVKAGEEMSHMQPLQSVDEAKADNTYVHGASELEAIAGMLTKSGNPLVKFIAPFIKASYNFTRIGMRRSVGSVALTLGRLGLLAARGGKNFWYNRIRGEKMEINPEFSPNTVRDAAEALLAGTATALLWNSVEGDPDDDKKKLLFTGSSPRSEATRGERENRRRLFGGDYMMRILGHDFNFARYEPAATTLGTTIDTIRAFKRKGDTSGSMNAMFGYFVAQMQSKTFLKGLGDMMESIQNAGSAKQESSALLRNIISNVVPKLFQTPMRNADDYLRDTRHEGILTPQTFFPTGEHATPAVDVFGKEIQKGGSAVSRQFFSQGMAADADPHPADRFLRAWALAHPAEKWYPDQPSRNIRDKATDEDTGQAFKHISKDAQMTAEQYHDYSVKAGAYFERILAQRPITERDIEHPTEAVLQRIKKAHSDADRKAKVEMFRRKPLLSPAYAQ